MRPRNTKQENVDFDVLQSHQAHLVARQHAIINNESE